MGKGGRPLISRLTLLLVFVVLIVYHFHGFHGFHRLHCFLLIPSSQPSSCLLRIRTSSIGRVVLKRALKRLSERRGARVISRAHVVLGNAAPLAHVE